MAKPATTRLAAESTSSGSRYKGVRKRKWGKWVSEIRLPNSRERIWLGSYDSPEKAARAFDAALFCLRGSAAQFNFPHDPPDIAGGRSLTPSEIQAAAAQFANSDPPRTHADPSTSMECYPSPSLSDGTVQMDGETAANGSFLDLLMTTGSGNNVSDFGIFPGFDDLSSDFFPQPPLNYGDENWDGVIPDQESFLWTF
ncbi:ethylene-responsive transcription factor ERF017 [Malania oleifera]|uniref:ethylene-responsive transcription factor ERF017 n=1 Tax=Malania oleifera TaxID=397392 RepID=UPI0025AE22F2|nr:ethylene-responsive transcription factor ERF017 [Malania oleifera]